VENERRRRFIGLAILLAGGLLIAYFAQRTPKDQHLRIVLGDKAPSVTAVSIQYETPEGEVLRDVQMTYEAGTAPRSVSLEPRLPDGDYRLKIDVDTREGRRAGERRVTLGGGTTSVEIP
jgi:hypothetical protein